MLLYLNAGFGELIGQDELDRIARMGFVGIRQDYAPESGRDLVAEFLLTDLRPIFLIGPGKTTLDPEAIGAAAEDCARWSVYYELHERPAPPLFEIINEPNLSPRYEKHPGDYALAVRQSLLAIQRHFPGATVIAGGVSNTDRPALDYLSEAVLYLPPDVWVGFHSYHTTAPPAKPHKGFPSRDAELETVKRSAGTRRIACTEIGRHTAPQRRGWWIFKRTYQETDEQVSEYLEWELRLLARHGVEIAVVYQYRDGPRADSSEDRFGMIREDGSEKPVAGMVRRVSGELA